MMIYANKLEGTGKATKRTHLQGWWSDQANAIGERHKAQGNDDLDINESKDDPNVTRYFYSATSRQVCVF